MKKFLALVVLICAVMFSSRAVAANRVPLCDLDAPTLTQALQEATEIKIWGMNKEIVDDVHGYCGHFGDSDKNELIFLLNSDNSIKALFINPQPISADSSSDVIIEQVLKLTLTTLIATGVTLEDLNNFSEEMISDFKRIGNSRMGLTEYQKNYSVRSAQTGREIMVSFSGKELNSGLVTLQFLIFARE